MSKKKVFFIIIAIVIIISAIFLIRDRIKQKNREYEIEQISKYNYFLLMENQKYGIIDNAGNKVIEPIYDSIQIPNPTQDIFVCYENDNSKILNSTNQEVLTQYENVETIKLQNIASDLAYEKTVLKYQENGKYGLIDFSGTKITEALYDDIQSLTYKEGELLVKQNEKYGIINIKGYTLIKNEYDSISADNYYNEETGYRNSGYIVSLKQDDGIRYGYINYKGKLKLKLEYNEVVRENSVEDYKTQYLIIAENGQYGVAKNGKIIIDCEYQSIEYDNILKVFVLEKANKVGIANIDGKTIIPVENESISLKGKYIYLTKENENIVYDNTGNVVNIDFEQTITPTENENYQIAIKVVSGTNYYGIMDSSNNQLVDYKYTYIEYAYSNYFIACSQEGKLGVIDGNGNMVMNFEYDLVQKIQDKNAIQTVKSSENVTEIYSSEMKKVYSMENANIQTADDYIKMYSEKDLQYFDNNGNQVQNTQILSDNTLFAKGANDIWGFVDKVGTIKVRYTYQRVTDFNQYGFAGVELNNRWGVLNSNGEVIVEPIYELDTQYREPTFIGKYYRVEYGIGESYYTSTQI